MKLDLGIEKRQEILQCSLLVEDFTSLFIAQLLNIKNYKETKSLGNMSGNLSFSQKVNLLIDMEALSPNERSKTQAFMEIRNQFMHNIEAKDYVTCFKYLADKKKFLLKTYPQNTDLPMEEQLHKASIQLASDVIKIIVSVNEKVNRKITEEAKKDILERYQKTSIDAIFEVEKLFNSMYDHAKSKGLESIQIEELKKLGTAVKTAFLHFILKK